MRMLATTKSERPTPVGLSDGRPAGPARAARGFARRDGDTDHVAEHRRTDLHADTDQKADQRRAGQEIGEKAELENAGEHEQPGCQQRDHADERHVVLAGRLGHARERAGEDRGGRRIRRHDEMARRAEDREGDERQENRVEAGDDRRSGDPRVAEHLRDVHRGQRQAGPGVAKRARGRIGRRPPKNGTLSEPSTPMIFADAGRLKARTRGTGRKAAAISARERRRRIRDNSAVPRRACFFAHRDRRCQDGAGAAAGQQDDGLPQGIPRRPDAKVKLNKLDPAYTGKHTSADEAKKEIEAYLQEAVQQQALLYAEHKHSILVVLQALDAGGKDGTIKHVFTRSIPRARGSPASSSRPRTSSRMISSGASIRMRPARARSRSSTARTTRTCW